MTGVTDANTASGSPQTALAGQVDHLLAGATSSGRLHTFALAQELSNLPASEQGQALKTLDNRLSPQQQGEVRRGLDQIREDARSLPPQYQRDADGKLEFTPAYTREACVNYHKLMQSNDDLGVKVGMPFAAGGALSGISGTVRAAMGNSVLGPVGVIGSMVGLVTGATDLGAKPPPGCK